MPGSNPANYIWIKNSFTPLEIFGNDSSNLDQSIFRLSKHRFLTGFTLIELLIVIGVMGIIVAIGIPALRSYQPSAQLSGVVQDLVTDLRYAQQLAIAEQVDHGIRFFIDDNKYQIIQYGEGETVLKEEVFPAGITFQQITGFTNNEAKFNPYGAARESGTIILLNTQGKTKTVDVRPSGFVKVSD